jgi:hypothetical protein
MPPLLHTLTDTTKNGVNGSACELSIPRRQRKTRCWRRSGRGRAALTILPKDLPQCYRFVADRIGSERTIDYLEFGVAHGNSIRTMAGMFTAQATKFYGFDSFLGLPERWFVAEVGAFRR